MRSAFSNQFAMAPLVSVLMPIYNSAAFLQACLDSILAQSLRNLELVAVDDGSTDGSAELLARHARADPRVRILRMPHRGIVAALNAGLAVCRGAYIARMDTDDLMHAERLERQLRYMEAHPQTSLCGTLVRPYGIGKALSDAALRYHDWLNSLQHDAEIKRELFVDSPIAHSTFFARRALYELLEGYRDCSWAEDYDFLFRASHAGAVFGKVPETLLDRGDWEGRLTRVDSHYKRKVMFAAKAHYFAAGDWLNGKTGVVIAGTGPSGRVTAAALRELEVPLRAFVDNRSGPPGRRVMGIPAWGDPRGPSESFLATHRESFFLLCIGEPGSRKELAMRLEARGMRPGRDYLRFI
ncbi:MAG: glycosyltransferase family 2 protein [SAR324 cluster bacterium]|nr:glycosyltransferase family 2 protein [SAR324 cluster bacterium]